MDCPSKVRTGVQVYIRMPVQINKNTYLGRKRHKHSLKKVSMKLDRGHDCLAALGKGNKIVCISGKDRNV